LHKPQNTVGQEELRAIQGVLESGWLTLGPKTLEFERIFAEASDCKYGVAASNCTASLFLGLYGLEVEKKSLVVIPANTFAATASAVRFYGAEPIFCDVASNGNVDVEKLGEILEKEENVDCLIPVHLYGFPCDMKEITRLSRKYGLKIIEDCAQAQGASFNGRKVGSFWRCKLLQFLRNKKHYDWRRWNVTDKPRSS